MTTNILVIDTSILCCWLQIPGKETAGSEPDIWNFEKANTLLTTEIAANSTLVLPVAVLIETGNHIANSNGNRFELANKLVEYLSDAANENSPWVAFTEQSIFWGKDSILELAQTWPELAKTGLSIADTTIKNIAEYYSKMGCNVKILTGDKGLKSYEPLSPVLVPRRRS
jgi:hypothetical protein